MVTPKINIQTAQESVIHGVLIGEMEGGEERVLGTLPHLGPHCFPDPIMRRIWTAIVTCSRTAGDAHPQTVFASLQEDAEASAWYVRKSAEWAESPWGVTPASTILFARTLVDWLGSENLRVAMLRATDLHNAGDPEGAAEVVRVAVAEFGQNRQGESDPGHVAELVVDETERMLSANPRDPRSVLWGLDALDEAGSYLRPGDFAVVAARPGAGKTTFAVQTFMGLLSRGRGPVLFASLEMTPGSIVRKAVLHRAGSRDPDCTPVVAAERRAITDATTWLAEQPLLMPSDVPASVDAFCSWLRSHIRKQEPRVVFIDYLGLIRGNGSGAYERMSDVSRKVRGVALHTEVPIIALHQMNRAAEGEKREPQMRDLRDSGQIEQDATHILFIHHKRSPGGGRRTFLVPRKSRWGGCPSIELDVDFARHRMHPVTPTIVTIPGSRRTA